MSLFDVVPEYPSAVCSMIEPPSVCESTSKIDSAVVAGVGRDAGGVVGKDMEKLVGISDASIRKHNRLYLLMQVHGWWKDKRAMGAQNNMEDEMGKAALGICDVCGERGALRTNHGKQMDSSCASIYAHLFNRLDLVAKVVVTGGLTAKFMARVAALCCKEEMVAAMQPYIPESLKIELEDGALDAIAGLVGYVGDDNEGLVELVGKIVDGAAADRADHDRAVGILRRANVAMPDGEMEYDALPERIAKLSAAGSGPAGEQEPVADSIKEAFVSSQNCLAIICRHLGIHPNFDLVSYLDIAQAVAQSEATLEDLQCKVEVICRHCGVADVDDAIQHVAHAMAIIDDLMGMVDEWAETPSDISLLIEKQGEELLNMRTNLQAKQDHINMLAEQVSDVEQRLDASNQCIAELRKALGDGAENLLDAELAEAVSVRLYAADGFAIIQSSGPMRDTVLLDLALDVLRGDVTGIDADRIGMMREIA